MYHMYVTKVQNKGDLPMFDKSLKVGQGQQ